MPIAPLSLTYPIFAYDTEPLPPPTPLTNGLHKRMNRRMWHVRKTRGLTQCQRCQSTDLALYLSADIMRFYNSNNIQPAPGQHQGHIPVVCLACGKIYDFYERQDGPELPETSPT